MRRQRVKKSDAQRFGLMGTGAIATLLSLYHFLSQLSGTNAPAANNAFPKNTTTFTSPSVNTLPQNNTYPGGSYTAQQLTSQLAQEALGQLVNYSASTPAGSTSYGNLQSGLQSLVSSLQSTPAAPLGDVKAFVFRSGGSIQPIAAEIGQAQRQVQVQAYSIQSDIVAEALAKARSRGVDVFVVLDASQQSTTNAFVNYLIKANVRTVFNYDRTLPQTKFILIDGHTIISGSFDNMDRTSDEHVFVVRNRSDIYSSFDASFANNFQRSQLYGTQNVPAQVTGYNPATTTNPFSTASTTTGSYSPINGYNMSPANPSYGTYPPQFNQPQSSFGTPMGSGYTTTPLQTNSSNLPLSQRQDAIQGNRSASPSTLPPTRRW